VTVVAIVDDHRLFSAALALALQARGISVVQPELTSMADVERSLSGKHPDVVLLDRDLGSLGNGEALIAPVTSRGASVLVISGSLDGAVMGRCLASGAAGCLSKTESLETVLAAVLAIAAGEVVTSPTERDHLIECWRRQQGVSDALTARFRRLTSREAVVLEELMDGRSVTGIAADDFVSEATVRTQVRSILQKLDVNSQLEAVALARRAGWRGLPPATPR